MTETTHAVARQEGPGREAAIAYGATALALLAMAVDHLMGDDPGLEDPPMFAIAAVLSGALAVLLFGRVVPRARGRDDAGARSGLLWSLLAFVPGVALLWVGLPFIASGAGLALGLHARERRPSAWATAAVVIGALGLLVWTVFYAIELPGKL